MGRGVDGAARADHWPIEDAGSTVVCKTCRAAGMAILGDAATPLRILCIALILGGVIGLKWVSAD